MTRPLKRRQIKFVHGHTYKGSTMATKKEIFASAMKICEDNKAPKALVEALTVLLEPKAGGATINLDEVTKKDANGKITHLQCSVSGKFLPADAVHFYEDKSGKGINGLRRLSRQAEAIRKDFAKVQTSSERAIMSDVLEGTISADAGKSKIAALKAKKADFSKVAEIKPTTEAK